MEKDRIVIVGNVPGTEQGVRAALRGSFKRDTEEVFAELVRKLDQIELDDYRPRQR